MIDYNQIKKMVFSFHKLRGYKLNNNLIEDVVQETFLNLLKTDTTDNLRSIVAKVYMKEMRDQERFIDMEQIRLETYPNMYQKKRRINLMLSSVDFKPYVLSLPPIYYVRIYELGRGKKHKRILKKIKLQSVKKVDIIYNPELNNFQLLALYFSHTSLPVYPLSYTSKYFFSRVPASTEYIIKKSLQLNDNPDRRVRLYLLGTLNYTNPSKFRNVFTLFSFEKEIQKFINDKSYYKSVLENYSLKTMQLFGR